MSLIEVVRGDEIEPQPSDPGQLALFDFDAERKEPRRLTYIVGGIRGRSDRRRIANMRRNAHAVRVVVAQAQRATE